MMLTWKALVLIAAGHQVCLSLRSLLSQSSLAVMTQSSLAVITAKLKPASI